MRFEVEHEPHFDLRSDRGFRHGYRDRDVNVVAFPREVFMTADIGNDVQVARRRAESSAVTFSWNPHARTRLNSGGDAHFHSLGFGHRAFALAQGAGRSPAAGATTVLTFLRKTQTAAGALHLARAFAGSADHYWPTNIAGAIATRTLFRTIDREVGS